MHGPGCIAPRPYPAVTPTRGCNSVQPPCVGPTPGHCARHGPRFPRGWNPAQGCVRNSEQPPGAHPTRSGRQPERTRRAPAPTTACSPVPEPAARPATSLVPDRPGPGDTRLHPPSAGVPEKPEPTPPARHNDLPGIVPASDGGLPRTGSYEELHTSGIQAQDCKWPRQGRHYKQSGTRDTQKNGLPKEPVQYDYLA